MEARVNINDLILGSTSKFRAEILRQSGVASFRQMASSADEEDVQSLAPKELALARSQLKAKGILAEPTSVIITADQVLEFEAKAYGKADNEEEAFARLRAFAGKKHMLHSCYTISQGGGQKEPTELISRVVTASLEMRDLTDEQIRAYLSTGEWRGCAGCYQFENRGAHLFKEVQGDSFTIIGLPLPQLFLDLDNLGVDLLCNPKGPWELIPQA